VSAATANGKNGPCEEWSKRRGEKSVWALLEKGIEAARYEPGEVK